MNFSKTIENNVMKRNFAGPSIMKDEIRGSNKKDGIRQRASPDSIAVELLEAFQDYGIEKIPALLNKIYDTC